MNTDYNEVLKHLQQGIGEFASEQPGTMSGFSSLHSQSVESGVLDQKTKELMSLAISIVIRCEGCIAFHAHDAIKAGATRQELLETISVAVMMGGGPATIYAVHAFEAIDQFLPDSAKTK